MKDNKGKRYLVMEMHSDNLSMTQDDSSVIRLSGIFTQFNTKNRNGRIYSAEDFVPFVDRLQERIRTNTLLGELDHPSGWDVSLKNASHVIEELTYDKENQQIVGKIRLLNTSSGREAQALVRDGVPLHISSRASGNIDASGHVTLENLFTYDLVSEPGFACAQLHRVNESLDCDLPSTVIVCEMDEKGDDGGKKDGDGKPAEKKPEEKKGDKPEEEDKENKDNKSKKVNMANDNENLSVQRFQKYSEYTMDALQGLESRIKNLEARTGDVSESRAGRARGGDDVDERLKKIEGYLDVIRESVEKEHRNVTARFGKVNESLKRMGDYSDLVAGKITGLEKFKTNAIGYMEQIARYQDTVAESINNLEGYQDVVAEQYNRAAGYLDLVSETVTNLTKYAEFINEQRENDSLKLKDLADYQELVRESITNLEKYQEVVNESVNNIESYQDKVVGKTINALEGYQEEVSKNVNLLGGYTQYLKEQVETNAGYSEYVAEELNEALKRNTRNMINERRGGDDDDERKPQARINEGIKRNSLGEYKESINARLDNIFANARRSAMERKEVNVVSLLNEAQQEEFATLDAEKQQMITEALTRADVKTSAQASAVWNKVYESKKTYDVLRDMPESCKASWNNLSANRKERILNEASLYELNTAEAVNEFWMTRDLREDIRPVAKNTDSAKIWERSSQEEAAYDASIDATLNRVKRF